jgi:superoxide dismutase, Fe-Mn family
MNQIQLHKKGFYNLPKLPYKYSDLEPFISKKQLQLHYEKHHKTYVKSANSILENLDKARIEDTEIDVKCKLKALSFNVAGHVLHSLFWENLTPDRKLGKIPNGTIGHYLIKEFGSFERFKKEFTQTALSVEGSGWATLAYCKQTSRPIIMQIEKHNMYVYPMFRILLVLDVWEHAYYLDYKNERGKYINAFWNNINWGMIDKRIEEILA